MLYNYGDIDDSRMYFLQKGKIEVSLKSYFVGYHDSEGESDSKISFGFYQFIFGVC